MQKFNFQIFLGVYVFAMVNLLAMFTLLGVAKYVLDDVTLPVFLLVFALILAGILAFTNKDIK